MTDKEQFCTKCGSELKEHATCRFDEETGKEIIEKHCPNVLCKKGCDYKGHVWGKWWKLQDPDRCQRCDYLQEKPCRVLPW